jgi:tetratricopeptide (TPR) repeat protein
LCLLEYTVAGYIDKRGVIMKSALTYLLIFFIPINYVISQILVPFPNDKSAIELNIQNISLLEYNIDPKENIGYWYVNEESNGLNISISFEKVFDKNDAKACREYYVQSLRINSKIKMSDEKFKELNDKSIYEYTIKEYQGIKVNNKNINVYMYYDNYCIDLHISKLLRSEDDLKTLENIVRTVSIKKDFVYTPMIDIAYGTLYFNKEDYIKAAEFYQKALNRYSEFGKNDLQKDEWRVLYDQLGMSYGMSGQLDKAKLVLEEGIQKDPEYPMFFYNLACVYAEKGDYENFIGSLTKAIKYKKNMIPGEVFPDPKKDPSFEKYINDKKFKKLILGL